MQSPAQFEAGLTKLEAKAGLRYALAMFSAAMRLAPAVRQPKVFVYVAAALPEAASRLGLKEVSSGANVSLLSPYDEGVFYDARRVQGVWVASPVQVYLDLYSYRGRGEEAAQAIWREVLKPSW